MPVTPFELFLSDEVQSLLDNFASLLDIRVTFYSADGRMLRRGRQMSNTDFSRVFRRRRGRPPGQYRDRRRRQTANSGGAGPAE